MSMGTSPVSAPALAALRRRIRANTSMLPPDECRALREAAGLHQVDIAEAVGVSAATVSAWERGDRTPTGAGREAYIRVVQVLREETTGRTRRAA